jgi:hypothetical protein
MKHTKEPWLYPIIRNTESLMILADDNTKYHRLIPVCLVQHNQQRPILAEDNARRIVECVNALTGIENPKEWVEAQSSRIAELEEALGNLTDEFSKPDYELIEKAKQLLNK